MFEKEHEEGKKHTIVYDGIPIDLIETTYNGKQGLELSINHNGTKLAKFGKREELWIMLNMSIVKTVEAINRGER